MNNISIFFFRQRTYISATKAKRAVAIICLLFDCGIFMNIQKSVTISVGISMIDKIIIDGKKSFSPPFFISIPNTATIQRGIISDINSKP